MASDLIERLRETVANCRNPAPKQLAECFWTELANEIEEAATALAIERERAEKAENEVERLREGVTIAARETLKAIGQRNKECSRAEAAEASLAAARALLKPFAGVLPKTSAHVAIDRFLAQEEGRPSPKGGPDHG